MTPLKALLAALSVALSAAPAAAEIVISEPYLRTAHPAARSGAAFMVIENTGPEDDRLLGVASEIAGLTELHTHRMQDGMVQMLPIEGGIDLPAGTSHALRRGGDHVMLMGLVGPLTDGAVVTLTLDFESAGAIAVEVPVDRTR